MSASEKISKLAQSLRAYFHHYRHAWLAIVLLALLIILLGQTPSTTPDAPPQGSPLSETTGTSSISNETGGAGETGEQSDSLSEPTPDSASPETSLPTANNEQAAREAAESSNQVSALPATNARPSLILIIDDIGNNLAAGMRAAALPGRVTLAVMPYTPHGRIIADAAYSTGQEIMLHMPMSNQAGMNLGPEGLTADLDHSEVTRRLRQALNDIPHIKGVNNHTGSELTELTEPMQWVMQELSHYPLYFIDSMTTADSVAFDTAREFAIPALKRHVFLDNVREESAIRTQFEQAMRIARQEGVAVAIGHPYEETLNYLEKALPTLNEQGVELHFASELLNRS